MNRKREVVFMGIGILAGLALSGPAAQAATSITAKLSTQPIYVDGQRVSMTAYSIGGNNYVRLRDIGRAVDFGVTYDAATNSVHIDSTQSYQDEVQSVATVTEDSVRATLAQLRETYPTGTVYPTPYRSTSGGPYHRGTHCSGWATLCSDAAFGNLPWRRVDNPSWEQIRPGDLIRYDNSGSGHVVVVISKTDEYIKVTESGLNNHARWGGQYFKWWLEEQSGYILYTRYPEYALSNKSGRRSTLAERRPSVFPRVSPCAAVCAHSADWATSHAPRAYETRCRPLCAPLCVGRIAPLSSKKRTARADEKYMSVLITLDVSHGYFRQSVVLCVAAKEGRTMHDYMKALEDRFTSKLKDGRQRQNLETKRQEVAALLDKQGRKKLLRLVDAHTAAQEETALHSFIAGFRLAWGIAMELGMDGSYSYEREWEEINRRKNYEEGVENDG